MVLHGPQRVGIRATSKRMRPDSSVPGVSVMLGLMAVVVALACMTTCHARERVFRIAWDGAPGADSYEVFLGIERIASTRATTAEIRVGYGTAIIAVRALNAAGPSPMSAPLALPAVWLEIRQTIEFSADLQNWTESFTPSARFARIRNETKP